MKRTQVNKPLKLLRKEIKVLQPPQLEHVVGGHGWSGGNYECGGGGGSGTTTWCHGGY
jgi:hypothetical protein